MNKPKGTYAPYKRGVTAKSLQVIHVPVTPRMLRAIEQHRLNMLESTGNKISRKEVIEAALWHYLNKLGLDTTR